MAADVSRLALPHSRARDLDQRFGSRSATASRAGVRPPDPQRARARRSGQSLVPRRRRRSAADRIAAVGALDGARRAAHDRRRGADAWRRVSSTCIRTRRAGWPARCKHGAAAAGAGHHDGRSSTRTAAARPICEAQRAALESSGVGVNVAQFVPHGSVRGAVLGMADRVPTAAELDADGGTRAGRHGSRRIRPVERARTTRPAATRRRRRSSRWPRSRRVRRRLQQPHPRRGGLLDRRGRRRAGGDPHRRGGAASSASSRT